MLALPPVLRSLNLANSQLDALLSGLGAYSDAAPGLSQIARDVAKASVRAPEVAIACVLLNQVAGRYAARHCVDSAIVACVMADALGRPAADVVTAAAAALTMNVGMMREIESFQTRTTALIDDERAIVRRHPVESVELLRSAGVSDEQWLDCVLQHHENHDGSGYPDGRRRDEIAFLAKLVGMADRYCACVSARNYRRSMLPPPALAKLCSDPGNDPELARHFSERLGDYPPGTLVRLADGATGGVCGRDGKTVLVHALRDAGGAEMSVVRRTDNADHAIDAALHEDEARLRFSLKSVWGELAAL
jgi:HD-GYP domain-containing protein (c-di-GMP phosphodiesterase class II)